MTPTPVAALRRRPRTAPFASAFLGLLLAAACTPPAALMQPRPDDPLDGYKGSLSESGVNTEIDLGPKQKDLLTGYKELAAAKAKLETENAQLLAEKKSLEQRLSGESDSFGKEKAARAQAEAEVQQLQQQRRELEAQILALGIEKAKLEQSALLGKIAELQRRLEDFGPAASPAPTGGGR